MQSNPNFFWGLWEYCEEKQTVEQEDSEIVQSLRKNGAHIIESYFSEEELQILRQNWEYAFMSFPDMSKIPFQNKRFKRAQQGGVTYIKGGPDDGRTRIMYFRPYKLFSIKLKDLLVKNTYLNKIVQEYFYLKNTFRPSQIMMEGLKPTRFNRTDKYWHIDNLSDQFKVMIVLEDMTEDDGPFSFIPSSHRIQPHQKDRYHKMYSMSGIGTHAHNHFEASFTEHERAKTVVAKAGDIVLFDCRIHHSGNFVQNSGSRKNMVLFYNNTPTLRNKILLQVNPYLHW